MDGNCNTNMKKNNAHDIDDICLHDARLSRIEFDEQSTTFYFPTGLYLTQDGSKTNTAIVKACIDLDDIVVFVSRRSKFSLRNREKYISKRVPFSKLISKLNNEIEIIDSMNQGNNRYLWRGVFLDTQGYTNEYVEIQFNSCDLITWEVYLD